MKLSCPILAISLLVSFSAFAANWPSWRGPTYNNTTPETQFPTEWNKEKNRKWRVTLPEPGNSSPIVWGDRIFVTQALEDGKRRTVMCFSRADGKLLWQRGVDRETKDSRHQTNPHCAASPVTDGQRVIASFASAGIVAYDFEGKELWRTDLGEQTHEWGQGSSPVIHGERCFVYHGPGKYSALYALDVRTGKKLWNVKLPESHPPERFDGFAGKTDGMLGSFSTPLVINAKGRDEVVLTLPNQMRAFAPDTGTELWSCDGLNPLIYTSPTYGEGIVVGMGGYFGGTVFARPGGTGNVTDDRRTFFEKRAKRHRIGSPIIKDGRIFVGNTIGMAECIELATGKTIWEERLKATGGDGETWASMVLAGDKLYVVNRSGDTFVLRASPTFEVIAVNSVGELSNSTLALSNGEIFLRTHQALWCISAGKETASR